MPKITLTAKESEEYFHNALCNIGGMLRSSGIEIDYNDGDYASAKEKLRLKSKDIICIEDVLMQILRDGRKLIFRDVEGGEHTTEVSLQDVHEKVKKTPIEHLTNMMNENDDAITADCILQTVAFGEIIFG